MSTLFAVMRREYLQRVKSRWFLISTFVAPAFFIGIMVLPIALEMGQDESRRRLAIIDQTGVLAQRVQPGLEEAGYEITLAARDAEDSLSSEALEGKLGGYVLLDGESLTRGHMTFVGREGPGAMRGMTMRGIVVQSALEARLAEAGAEADLDALFGGGSMDVRILEEEGGGTTEGDPEFIGVFAGAMLLYFVVLMYAAAVMRSALEEKTSRVVEILISSVRPWELMLGKIVGVGSVGLTQLAVWILVGVLGFTLGIPALVAARPDMADPEAIAAALPDLGQLGLFVALFLGGYFLYSAVYAAIGAMCSTEEEAQQAQFPVVIFLVLPAILLMPVMTSPNEAWVVVLSMVPLFSPVLLYARAGSAAIPLWQIGLSLVLLYLSVWAAAWVAGRIYRVGILMQGKRPNLPELWRWVRAA